MSGSGTPDDPWNLTTPSGGGGFQLHLDPEKDVLHCQVGTTWLHYRSGSIEDLHAMLVAHGDWMELGNKDEKQETKPGTVEHWARSADNPVGGWYGLRKGYRGRFANHVTPALVAQGRAELEKRGRSMWVRALP
ncbi:MAG: hypothetical protein KC656_02495 [Myxococcales bacterium]|nr:hypothetical protein [Myxococcales bacterium]MCB9671071.1 hypothetical protein [Alphaproteobacteria bacterium]MCB9692327.1 hypothetical protein [Alphaproteobacteria bacterium]